jgi:sarcosine oxidase gamma subunit
LKVEYAPLFKLSVCFAEPLASDLVLDGLVSLPAAQGPQKRQDLYALAVNRYNKVVLSEDEAKLDSVQVALSAREDVLVGDASSAITSAGLSGVYAAELLSRAVDVDPASIVDGGYVRCQFDHAVIVIHRVNDTFLLHWPEPLTAYLVQWIETVVGLDRD